MTLINSDLGGHCSNDGMHCLRAYKMYYLRTLLIFFADLERTFYGNCP